MKRYYVSEDKFHVSVDCIIFGYEEGEVKVLLKKRGFAPFKGEWSLMGGFVHRDESIAFGEVMRDPGDRVISVAYYALLKIDERNRERVKEHNAQWVSIGEIPPLGFDHPQMIAKAREMMKRKVPYYPIGFNLLPEFFTLTQLQSLYEIILEEPIDKRNFRKRIAEMTCVEKTDLIDKSSSRRGASLYRFNEDIYNQQLKFRL
jgi:hypothetical protein